MYESAVQWQQRMLRVTLFRQSEKKNQDQNDDIARILWAFKISKIEQSATFSFGVAIFGAQRKAISQIRPDNFYCQNTQSNEFSANI